MLYKAILNEILGFIYHLSERSFEMDLDSESFDGCGIVESGSDNIDGVSKIFEEYYSLVVIEHINYIPYNIKSG